MSLERSRRAGVWRTGGPRECHFECRERDRQTERSADTARALAVPRYPPSGRVWLWRGWAVARDPARGGRRPRAHGARARWTLLGASVQTVISGLIACLHHSCMSESVTDRVASDRHGRQTQEAGTPVPTNSRETPAAAHIIARTCVSVHEYAPTNDGRCPVRDDDLRYEPRQKPRPPPSPHLAPSLGRSAAL